MNLVEFSRKATRKPVHFKDRGRDFDGWDCWGLVCCAYDLVYGITLDGYESQYCTESKFGDVRNIKGLMEVEKKESWIDVCTPQQGDIAFVFMRGLPVHVGIMLDAKRMLHVRRGIDTCVQPLSNFRVEGIYRYDRS